MLMLLFCTLLMTHQPYFIYCFTLSAPSKSNRGNIMQKKAQSCFLAKKKRPRKEGVFVRKR
ncbi:hypothetical protein COO59_18420 [Mixta theicola]|uniref:Uncharacterized protein n=1 Tax=Mixta theicola TaxID=1458355 RepID=A0A2K1Q5A6_9GAMM|nr:hypothetical protein COO59_18420 [Mixta theicola]